MKRIILITGGQRSGKSSYAEQMALSWSANPVYMATARVWDDEFRQRVERHQASRGMQWTNIEEEKTLSRHDVVASRHGGTVRGRGNRESGHEEERQPHIRRDRRGRRGDDVALFQGQARDDRAREGRGRGQLADISLLSTSSFVLISRMTHSYFIIENRNGFISS